jgi:hypothetical protein
MTDFQYISIYRERQKYMESLQDSGYCGTRQRSKYAQRRCLCMARSAVFGVARRSREGCALRQHQLQLRWKLDNS